jgi:hypothetical protein
LNTCDRPPIDSSAREDQHSINVLIARDRVNRAR